MKIGITGSTSGLGTRLSNYLLSKDLSLRLLVRNKDKAMEIFGISEKIEYQSGDITNREDINDFIKGVDICYHIAAQVGHATPEQYQNVNVNGTKNICKAIHQNNRKCKLIFCSTVSILRIKPYNLFLFSEYTKSKYYAEKVINQYQNKIDVCIIYPGLIYGPNDRNLLPIMLNTIKSGIPFLVKGGEKNIPLVYIDDLVELFYAAGMNPISTGKKYVSVKNSEIGIHTLIKKIAEKSKIDYVPPEKKYPKLPLLLISTFFEFIKKRFNSEIKIPVTKRFIDTVSLSYDNQSNQAFIDLGWDHKISIEKGLELAMASYNVQSKNDGV